MTEPTGWTLESWVDALAAALQIEPDLHTDALLDLTRDVAHGVARPAAPLTLFLVGWAAAARGGAPADLEDALRTARALIDAAP